MKFDIKFNHEADDLMNALNVNRELLEKTVEDHNQRVDAKREELKGTDKSVRQSDKIELLISTLNDHPELSDAEVFYFIYSAVRSQFKRKPDIDALMSMLGGETDED